MALERLTSLSKTTDTTIKQGDTSSRMGFRLSSRDGQVFNGPAQLQLINSSGEVHEQMVDVVDNHFEFKLDTVLPADTYTVEVEIDGYVFPSAKDRTITIRQNLGEDSPEVQEIKRLSIRDEVTKYLKDYETAQIDLDVLIERLEDRLPEAYDDGPLTAQISEILEQIETLKQSDGPSVQYDDSELRGSIRGLSERLATLSNYDDTAINQRLTVLESKNDNDTVYDDGPIRELIKELRDRPDKDTIYNDLPLLKRLITLEQSKDGLLQQIILLQSELVTLKQAATPKRRPPTGWSIDKNVYRTNRSGEAIDTTKCVTAWFDNGCGFQNHDFPNSLNYFGIGGSNNQFNTVFDNTSFIANIMSAAHGTLSADYFKRTHIDAQQWSDRATVIYPINDASLYDWSGIRFGSNAGSYGGRNKNLARVLFELGIWSESELSLIHI